MVNNNENEYCVLRPEDNPFRRYLTVVKAPNAFGRMQQFACVCPACCEVEPVFLRGTGSSVCSCGQTTVHNPTGWGSRVPLVAIHSSTWTDWIKFWFGLDRATLHMEM